MAAKVKNENYVTIQGFMINELKLSGNELIAYAVIYGFSQADGQYMTCSQEYIGNWCNLSRESTNRLLKRLVEKGLIVKRLAISKGSMKLYDYKAVHKTSDETSHASSDETSRGTSGKTSHGTSGKTSHHKKTDNYNNYNKRPSTNKFNNFKQRPYTAEDFENMERLLLNRTYGIESN